jgi:uncharacterized RDD family membrane protein YckC
MAPDREQFLVSTAQHAPIAFDVAGLGDRFLAALIDYAVLGASLGSWGLGVAGLGDAAGLDGPWVVSLFVVGLIPALVYFPFCELVFDGQTIGKRARGLRVMRISGAAPTLGDLLLRWLLRPIDLWATSGLAAVATVLYTGTGQRLGDLAAGTTVVEQRARTSLDDTLFTDLPDDYEPSFPGARALGRDDVETVRRVLRRLSNSPDGRASERARTLAAQARKALLRRLDTSTDLDPVPFLKTVLRDYNYYRQE